MARGTLLRVTQAPGPAALAPAGGTDWYFANTEKGRQAVNDLLAGKWTPGEPGKPLLLQAHRPNIFVLYEQNVGPLTPLLAEQLQDAEKNYPAPWIEDAFKEAAELNKRSWRYVQRILERWATEGKGDETARRGDDRKDRRRFIEGEYADYHRTLASRTRTCARCAAGWATCARMCRSITRTLASSFLARCKQAEIDRQRAERLRAVSNLTHLSHMTFDAFVPEGYGLSPDKARNLRGSL